MWKYNYKNCCNYLARSSRCFPSCGDCALPSILTGTPPYTTGPTPPHHCMATQQQLHQALLDLGIDRHHMVLHHPGQQCGVGDGGPTTTAVTAEALQRSAAGQCRHLLARRVRAPEGGIEAGKV